MDKVIGLGRIWRITHDSMERDKNQPNMLEETPAQLVKHLEHPNGWWRDQAQQLIVLSQDKSVVPQLEKMVKQSDNLLARFHALWSLEGLDSLKPNMVKELLNDPDPRMRVQALRVSETLYKAGNKSFGKIYLEMLNDKNVDVALQAILTAHILEVPSLDQSLAELLKTNKAKGIQSIGTQILEPKEVRNWWEMGNNQLTDAQKNSLEQGRIIFNELCVQCHGNDGTGTPVGDGLVMAPPLSGSARVQSHPEYVIKTVMHGLEGPLEGKTYPAGIMVGNEEQSDEWIAAIVSYIRTNLSNEGTLVTAEEVKKVREKTVQKEAPYTYKELVRSVPQIIAPNEDWKVTASHSVPTRIGGRASPYSAFNFEGWSTGGNQEKEMWYQIEFPELMNVSEIHYNATPISRGWRPDAPPPLHTYPRGYILETSTDGSSWKEIENGKGEQADVSMVFEPVRTKFVRMRLTENFGPQEDREIPWSIRQMKIYGYLE